MSAKPQELPTPESIAKYVKQNTQKARKSSAMMAMMHHKGGQDVVREDDYKGHHIIVRTTYTITVDGREITGHLMLTNAGQVQYHGLPNHSFDSAIGLVRALIDNFPEDFEKKQGGAPRGGMEMKGHGDMAGMAGMRTAGTKKKSTAKSAKRPAKSKSK